MNPTYRATLPLRIVSEANMRQHWAQKAKRAKAHRQAVGLLSIKAMPLPLTVTLTRIGPRRLDDDNLAGGFKATRDQIANKLGIDDGDPRITWRYAQEPGKPKQYEVRIEIVTNSAVGTDSP